MAGVSDGRKSKHSLQGVAVELWVVGQHLFMGPALGKCPLALQSGFAISYLFSLTQLTSLSINHANIGTQCRQT